jgi:hypothetical protein
MQLLDVSNAVRHIHTLLGGKVLIKLSNAQTTQNQTLCEN